MSLSIYAGFRSGEGDTITNVILSKETISHFYSDNEDDCEGTLNPDYNPIFDINWSNDNASMVLGTLGIHVCEGYFEVSLKSVVNLTTQWLRNHINKPVAGRTTFADGRNIHLGTNDGYLNNQIHRLSVLARAAQERGANIIYGA